MASHAPAERVGCSMIVSQWLADVDHGTAMTHSYHTLERGTVSQVESNASFYCSSIVTDKHILSGAHLACVAVVATGLLLSEG
jgi:hypothetical protein